MCFDFNVLVLIVTTKYAIQVYLSFIFFKIVLHCSTVIKFDLNLHQLYVYNEILVQIGPKVKRADIEMYFSFTCKIRKVATAHL